MPANKKVLAAVSAAVDAYIQDDEAALQQKTLAERPSQPYSPWVMSGRTSSMDVRRVWQMRLVR